MNIVPSASFWTGVCLAMVLASLVTLQLRGVLPGSGSGATIP